MSFRTRRRLVTVMSGTMAGGVPPADSPGGVSDGLGAWYKADSLVLANGASVPAWTDSGPNALNLTSSGVSHFVYRTMLPYARNGVPTMDNTATAGTRLTRAAVSGAMLSGATAQTVFVVQYKNPSALTTCTYFFGAVGTNQLAGYMTYNLPPKAVLFDNGHPVSGGRVQVNEPPFFGGSWHIVEQVRAVNAAEVLLEGNTIGTGTFTDAFDPVPTANLSVAGFDGGVGQFNGLLAEVIFYNRTLTTTERDSVRNYLKSKWGIAQNKLLLEDSGGYFLLEDGSSDRVAMEA